MRKLINPRMMPPTGFFYVDPATEFKVETSSLTTLCSKVRSLLKANDLPIAENLEAIVEDFICMNNHPDFSKGEAESSFNVPLTESWIRSSSQEQLIAWRKSGGEFVDAMEADRRGEVCSHCKLNVRSPICFSCVGMDTMVDGYFSRHSACDKDLRVCNAFAVPNKSLIHIKAEALLDTDLTLPESCWYRKELEQRK